MLSLCKCTLAVLKGKYKRKLRDALTAEDKFDMVLKRYDDTLKGLVSSIGELTAAKTCLEQTLGSISDSDKPDYEARVKQLGAKIDELKGKATQLYEQRNTVAAKYKEYVARINAAGVLRKAAESMSGLFDYGASSVFGADDIVADCDAELARLEAETATLLNLTA